MAIGDYSEDDLTPPGWLQFVQPSSPLSDQAAAGLDAPAAPAVAPPTASLAVEAPAAVEPARATPEAPSVLGSIRNAGTDALSSVHNLLTPSPIASEYVEPMSPPPPSPDEGVHAENYIDNKVADAGPLPSAQDEAERKAVLEKGKYYYEHPGEAMADDIMRRRAAEKEANADRLALAAENERRAQADYETHVRAREQTQRDMQTAMAKAQEVASMKPDPELHRGPLQGVLDVVAMALGGAVSHYTGGRNLALEQYNKIVDMNYDAQKQKIANLKSGAAMQMDAITAQMHAEGEDYRDRIANRIGWQQRAMDALATKAQDFDARGTTAQQIAQQYGAFQQAQAKSMGELQKTSFDQAVKIDTSRQKWYELGQKDTELADKRAEWMAKQAAKGGAGRGSNTNPNYTVATGLFDPFTNEPIYSRREIDMKGEKSEGRVVHNQIATYAHEQDDWRQLKALGKRIEFHKSLGESIWSKWKNTDAAEYDALTSKLVVNLTKALGDKLTQGQLDEQGHRIPQRTSWLESRDVEKMITDSQEESDQDFMRDMNTIGVDGASIIKHAQESRAARPEPDPRDAVAAAQEAIARTEPGSSARRDAEAARDLEQERLAAQLKKDREGAAAVDAASTFEPLPMAAETNEGILGAARPAIAARNEAVATYNKKLGEMRRLQSDQEKERGKDLEGVANKRSLQAEAKYQKELQAAAIEVVRAREVAERANTPKGHTSRLELVPGLLDAPVESKPQQPAAPTQLQPGAESLFPQTGPRVR